MYFQLRGWLEQVVEIGQKQDSERRVEILGFHTLYLRGNILPHALVSVIWILSQEDTSPGCLLAFCPPMVMVLQALVKAEMT